MKFMKKISFILLAALSLAQMPQVCGMASNAEARLRRIERRVERSLHSTRTYWVLPTVIGSVGGFLAAVKFVRSHNDHQYGPEVLGWLTVAALVAIKVCPKTINRAISASMRNNPEDPENLNPLFSTVAQQVNNNVGSVLLRAKGKKSVDGFNRHNLTALMRAAQSNGYALAQAALANGADIDLNNNKRKNALIYAIDRDDVEMVRMLLFMGAHKEQALRYVTNECGAYQAEVNALIHAGHPPAAEILRNKQEDLAKLRSIQQLFLQTPAQLLAPLTQGQKADYKKMFASREAIKPSLHGSLMLYEHFNEDAALKKYLRAHKGVYQGLAEKSERDPMTNIMSFLRKKPDETKQRLKNALDKAVEQGNHELATLLRQNGTGYAPTMMIKFTDGSVGRWKGQGL